MQEYRRKLPHFHPDHAYLFLTWRLWGSLASNAPIPNYPTPGHAFVAADRELHAAQSRFLWLKDPKIAECVASTIQAGECERAFYELYAWVVMPNHVHLLILPKVPVAEITRWLKGSTARYANQFLGRTGLPFWLDYIERNPVSAGLIGAPEHWPWSSATGQAKPPAPPAPPALCQS